MSFAFLQPDPHSSGPRGRLIQRVSVHRVAVDPLEGFRLDAYSPAELPSFRIFGQISAFVHNGSRGCPA